MRIIGLSGMNGSGKDTVADLLAKKYGFMSASATDMLVAELNARGEPLDRTHKAALSAEWRRKYGMAVIVDRAYAALREYSGKYKGLIVGSLRHPAEANRVHELGGEMLWIDADPEVRYKRIVANAALRGRSAEDNLPYETWLADERREMHPSGDGATLNMSAVRELSDLVLINNQNDIEVFEHQAEELLGLTSNPDK